MLLELEKYKGATVVGLPNNIVYKNAEIVKNQLFALIENGLHKLCLNLNDVSFIDSSGLAVLVAAFKEARRNGGKLALLKPQQNTVMLLELTRLDELFDVFFDKSMALSHLAANDNEAAL